MCNKKYLDIKYFYLCKYMIFYGIIFISDLKSYGKMIFSC